MVETEVHTEQIRKSAIKGSESFRLEYDPSTPEKAIWNDVVSYLGEYRFQVQKYQYKLFYTQGVDGLHIRGEEKGKSLLDIGQKGIEDRQKRGEVTKKVVADFVGMQKMEAMLQDAQTGDTIMYASPADPEEGYTYGFFYIGHVVVESGQEHIQEDSKKEKHLEMTAIRLEHKQELMSYNAALKLLAGEDPNFTTVNQFIAHPKIVQRKLSTVEIDFVMKGVFDFAMDQKQQNAFADVIHGMKLYIDEFIHLVKLGTHNDILEPAFYALENYALELQKESLQAPSELNTSARRLTYHDDFQPRPNLARLAQTHGYEPPKVTGSCGSSSKNKLGSSDIFGQGSLFEGEVLKEHSIDSLGEDEEEGFECPNCHVGWVKGNQCPHCKITAEEWAEQNPDIACV